MSEPDEREVYFEFIAIGNAVKVTAIDSLTGIEVSIMGPASAAQSDLEQLALQKLKARLKREEQPSNQHIAGCERRPSNPWRMGADMLGQAIPGEPNVRVR